MNIFKRDIGNAHANKIERYKRYIYIRNVQLYLQTLSTLATIERDKLVIKINK